MPDCRRREKNYSLIRLAWGHKIDSKKEEKEIATLLSKRPRDGYSNDSKKNKYFKHLAKKTVRRSFANNKIDIVEGDDYAQPMPGDYMGKKHIWSVW